MRRMLYQERLPETVTAVDPRIRLMASLLLLALVVGSTGTRFPWLVVCICLPAALFSGMPLRQLALRLLHPFCIALMVLVLKACFGSGPATASWSFGSHLLTVKATGLAEGMAAGSRIMGAASIVLLLCRVLTFTETMAALAWLRVPRCLIEISLFAWRSLFVFYDSAGVVYTAQKNRLGYCGIRRSLRSFGTMAGMLVVRALDDSFAMTTAMTQRGYDGSLPLLRDSHPRPAQLVGLACFALIAGLLWLAQN